MKTTRGKRHSGESSISRTLFDHAYETAKKNNKGPGNEGEKVGSKTKTIAPDGKREG